MAATFGMVWRRDGGQPSRRRAAPHHPAGIGQSVRINALKILPHGACPVFPAASSGKPPADMLLSVPGLAHAQYAQFADAGKGGDGLDAICNPVLDNQAWARASQPQNHHFNAIRDLMPDSPTDGLLRSSSAPRRPAACRSAPTSRARRRASAPPRLSRSSSPRGPRRRAAQTIS